MKKRILGFTLIELLVVISIIGILLAISTAAFTTAQGKGRNAKRRSDVKAIQSAQEQYYAQNSSSYASVTGTPCGGAALVTNGYLSSFPTDPKNTAGFQYSCATLSLGGSNVGYCACAALEGNEVGNSSAAADGGCTGLGSTGSFYCARQLQ